MKNISLFGSTGSIGKSTLKIIEKYPDKFTVNFLSAFSNMDLLIKQIKKYKPKFVYVPENNLEYFKKHVNNNIKIFSGKTGLIEAAELDNIDLIVMGISGIAALKPVYAALRRGKKIALANKESIVSGGEIIKRYMNNIIPVDSEHSSLYQLMNNTDKTKIRNIYLTASGGPFLNKKIDGKIKYEDVLKHPVWNMGEKITVDSATMANKALEIIEAFYIFGMKPDNIKVIIHPQSIIHSMIEFYDGVFFSQLSNPDMMYPISYALFYPERAPDRIMNNSIIGDFKLEFRLPDFKKFPFLEIAYDSIKKGGARTIVFNAANDESVNLFLNKKIGFRDIFKIVNNIYENFDFEKIENFDKIFEIYDIVKNDVRKIAGEKE
jgi:1-deoxy-D-xylulose-5-phosphate reductoisomerase